MAEDAEAVVKAEVEALRGLTIDQLRAAWRRRFAAPAPPLRSGDLMRRILAEKIQMQAYGADTDLDRKIGALVRAYQLGSKPEGAKATFKVGTILLREYAGVTHRVEVLSKGFGWDGRVHASLSAIARQITGVRWNGPKFFGLRQVDQ